MSRFVYLPLVFLLLTLLTACGGGELPPAEPTPTTAALEPTAESLAPTIPPEPTASPEPTAEPTAEPTLAPTPALATINQYGLTAAYPTELGQNVIASIQEPQTDRHDLIAYYQLAWVDYPVTGAFAEPVIEVYNTANYSALDPFIAQEIAELQTLLADQPDLTQKPELPYVYVRASAQMLHTQEAYLSFQNGRGIRYLTFYAQNVVTITSKDLFYNFQGFTDDGQFFVRATFPIEITTLPTERTMPELETYRDYVDALAVEIRQLDPAVFNPLLSHLDQLIQSLTIQAEPLPPIPTPEPKG